MTVLCIKNKKRLIKREILLSRENNLNYDKKSIHCSENFEISIIYYFTLSTLKKNH
jgi:hypothetical protein